MLYWLAKQLTPYYSGFNVFSYLTTRTIFAVITALTLFLSSWFVVRQLSIDVLTDEGLIRPGEQLPLFVDLGAMVEAVGSLVSEAPITLLAWGFALLTAWSTPTKD